MTQPDPEPSSTPGLEPGGGVAPGDTPPGEGSSTTGTSRATEPVGRTGGYLAVVAVGVLVAMVILFFVFRAIDLF